MIKAERKEYIEKISFKNKEIKGKFLKAQKMMDSRAEDILLKVLYQNGHQVVNVRNGETKVGGRREVIYVEVTNLNQEVVNYRVDIFGQGHCCDKLGNNIRKGWQPVAVW